MFWNHYENRDTVMRGIVIKPVSIDTSGWTGVRNKGEYSTIWENGKLIATVKTNVLQQTVKEI